MVFDINNFFDSRNKKSKIGDFQDLDHIDGISISSVSANLYEKKRDDLVLFYFIGYLCFPRFFIGVDEDLTD